ncbi:FMN-binding negative transcriptional regulator [Agaribacterium haliotis]|uniref:FMN-binding negative transcriptional regulator n=1 Tax=Agaribacterium haliotis TaxID=2013869 RepID=UPI000BB52E66|nr:FMN-binding negative transcriptional regulator [Agaribacterium haliotis]
MHIPEIFKVQDKEKLFEFIENNAFGQLISSVEGRIFSTALPFLVAEDKKSIFAHIAKANVQHLELSGQEVLLSFQGPHGYISPAWYDTAGVPTWNYQTVHIYGCARVFSEANKLKWLVEELSKKYENKKSEILAEQPWAIEYKKSMLAAIVGIEINITEVQGKFKLSQNRSLADRENVMNKLKQNGNKELAKAMQEEQSQ